MTLPPCGLYKTTVPIESVPAERLVYFHNHGDPGAGVYLPTSWQLNRAQFSERGITLPDESLATTLVPLSAEGLYRVEESFICCERKCRDFEANRLVQLGYNGQAEAILFEPTMTPNGLLLPEMGTKINWENLRKLQRLSVRTERATTGDLH